MPIQYAVFQLYREFVKNSRKVDLRNRRDFQIFNKYLNNCIDVIETR